jgi:hypothetical protein
VLGGDVLGDVFGADDRASTAPRGRSEGRLPRGFPRGFPIELPPGFPTRLPGRRRAPGDGDAVAGAVRVGAASLFGCLGRLAMIALVLVALMVAAFFALAGGGNVRSWVTDLGQQVGVVEGVPAQTARGIAAYRAGDRALAERELADAARAYPRSAVALLYLGVMRIDAGDGYRAREYLTEAVRREPESAVVRRTVGEYGCALAARGEAAEAAEMLGRAGAGPWERCRSGGASGP